MRYTGRVSSLIGKRLGGYRIEGELGKGGMGVVYLARQVELDRRVALKLLPPQFTIDEAFVRRFRREARAIAQLNHPNIVQVYDIGEQDGAHYYAMELVEGETLDDRIFRKQHLNVTDAVRSVVQVCRGLHAAHEAGIIHRDIKPANILFDRRGNAKLTDFGIALHGTAERLTTLGTIVGTPEYMSPEQASGKTTTPQSDIYSLGIVFYEMLTGGVPFDNKDALVTLQQHQFDEPRPPSELNADVPIPVERVVLKMLAKEPEGRYQSCADVIADLRLIVKGDATSSSAQEVQSTGAPGQLRPAPTPATTRWAMLLGAGGLAATATALALILLRPAQEPAAPMRPPVVHRVPDMEALAGLLSLYDAQAEIGAAQARVSVHLRNGGILPAPDAHAQDGGAVLTYPDMGPVFLPASALAEDTPLRPRATTAATAQDRQIARAWARDVFDTWKLDHQVDFVRREEMPPLMEDAAAYLPPVPPPAYGPELRTLAAASAEWRAAREANAAAQVALTQQRSAPPDASLQFPDRVVFTSGRELVCRILDAESDMETLRVQLPEGGRMRIPFTELRHFERAYGQAAAAADQARDSLRTHRARIALAKQHVEEQQQGFAAAQARHGEAVAALALAAAPPEPSAAPPTAEPAPAPPLEGFADAPPPTAIVLWEEAFDGPVLEDGPWRVATECAPNLQVEVEDANLVLASATDLGWQRCAPHVSRKGLTVAGAARLEVTVQVESDRVPPGGVLACWIEVEGTARPPLAYLLYSTGGAVGSWPAGQAQPVPLIERAGLLAGEPGAWRTVTLPLAADWARAGTDPVTLTGVRLVHFRERAGTSTFVTRFTHLQVYGIDP